MTPTFVTNGCLLISRDATELRPAPAGRIHPADSTTDRRQYLKAMTTPTRHRDGSDVQVAYRTLRDSGHGHEAALIQLADDMAVDLDTVKRVLRRADDLDRLDPHRTRHVEGVRRRGR